VDLSPQGPSFECDPIVQVRVIRSISGYNVSQIFDIQIVVYSIAVVEQVREGVYVRRYFYPTCVLCGG
jgi:hypothetical protein